MTDLATYLAIISGGDGAALVEVRYAVPAGMSQQWFRADYEGLPRFIVDCGRQSDTYVGVAPRTERAGGRDAVSTANVLWVDCDTPESVERLAAFKHRPTMTIASGSGDNRHAYWALARPLPAPWVLRANQRLCHALAADPKCAEVARILRPPQTLNHKHSPPTPVTVADFTGGRYPVAALVADLPDPPNRSELKPRVPRDGDLGDDLAAISPMVYVPLLTGREPDARGKVACPFHEDWDPSLQVYEDPSRGWYCFQCEAGGTIFDLAARLWDIGTRGDDFKALRERLAREMGVRG